MRNIPGLRQLAVLRAFAKNQKIDRALRRERSKYTLTPQHLANLRVLTDRAAMLDLMPSRGHVAEVGVATGDFSLEILERTRPEHLYLIDPWVHGRYKAMYDQIVSKGLDRRSNVSILRDFSFNAIPPIPDRSLDWAYIDAAHDFENVQTDLNLIAKKIKDDGIIAGDDYSRWSSNGLHRWGVVEAVNLFCIENDFEFIYLTSEPGRLINYAIRRR